MNQLSKLDQLGHASYFDTLTLGRVLGLQGETLHANIGRWVRQGILLQLRRGLYVTADYLQTSPVRDPYTEFIANRLKVPSYLSMEYVLQKQALISESVFGLTSVTRKKTYHYQNTLGIFTYASIKPALFTGYEIVTKGAFEIRQARPMKALFDYLYFRTQRVMEITSDLILSFRLNLDQVSDAALGELAQYAALSSISKYSVLPNIIRELRDAH